MKWCALGGTGTKLDLLRKELLTFEQRTEYMVGVRGTTDYLPQNILTMVRPSKMLWNLRNDGSVVLSAHSKGLSVWS